MKTTSALVPVFAACMMGCTAATDPATCAGGGAPLLELGDGGRSAFVAFADGVALPTSTNGLTLEMQTSGIDTTQNVTAVVRIAADGGPSEDSIAALSLQCESAADGTGFGWAGVIASLPASTVEGSAIDIEAVITDWRGITATTSLSASVR